jgi:predicted RNA polymerase sigma factor
VKPGPSTEGLLRELAPQVLGALVRRYGDFAGSKDALQEALFAAAGTWPADGTPDDPRAWLYRVAARRLANQYRADDARRRREDLAASWSVVGPAAGLAVLDGLDDRLGVHHRLHSARAHLLEMAGDTDAAATEFSAAADRTTNRREQQYLTTKAAGLAAG